MKRCISILLTLALACALALPAAAETAQSRLTRVTDAVKRTLALNTEGYTDFEGTVSQGELATVWSLRWNGEEGSLNIEALEDGTVMSLWRYTNGAETRRWNALPAFPKEDLAAARSAAETFLGRVLKAGTESVRLEDPTGFISLGDTQVSYSGPILLNGLPSPLTYRISVRDGEVLSFRRDILSSSFMGGIPSSNAPVSQAAALSLLGEKEELELIYAASEGDPNVAVLRYVPKVTGQWLVDARTGELVTWSDMMWGKNGLGATPAEAEESAASMDRGGLTAAELAGAEKLQGLLTQNELDAKVRSESAYMLSSYSVASADYRLSGDEEGTVLCSLRYTTGGEEPRDRVFTVNARTGEVLSLWSYGAWDKDRSPSVTLEGAERLAGAFLKRYVPGRSGDLALYDTVDETNNGAPSYRLTFARVVNGYFFPADSYAVEVDCVTGAVCGLSGSWNDQVHFTEPGRVITPERALDAWMATFEAKLAYRAQARTLRPSVEEEKRLIDLGYETFNYLLLTYGLEQKESCIGIDARTGDAVRRLERYSANSVGYTDTAGHWAAAEITRLSKYGVGYLGESFRPDSSLTQWDLVCLLSSVSGLRLDPEKATAEERDAAYEAVSWMGALERGERNDSAPVDRGTLVKVLLRAAGYDNIADLQGIFYVDYEDWDVIPEADRGYAAVARALGLVNGRYDGAFRATRATAAVMLCRVMDR